MAPGYQDPNCTVFVSNVEQRVTEEHLWELFLQAGPLRNVHIPVEKGTGKNRTFAFVTYREECSVSYACELFNTLRLFQKPIYCKPTKDSKHASPSSPAAGNQSTKSEERLASNQSDSTVNPNSRMYSSPKESSRDRREYNSSDVDKGLYSRPPVESRNENYNRNSGGRQQYGENSPWQRNDSNFPHYQHDDRGGNFRESRDDRGSNHQRYPGPNGSPNNTSPAFFQAISQSINQIRRQSSLDHSPRNNSPQFGPMRHEPLPQNRNRRYRTQPY